MSWNQLAIPSAGPVRFYGPTFGWLAGGAGNNLLYVTRDGGQNWQQVNLPRPATLPSNFILAEVELPSFFDSQDGVVPAEYGTELTPQTALVFSSTADGGNSWVSKTPFQIAASVGVVAGQVSIVDSSTWIIGVRGKLYTSTDGGSTWSVRTPNWPAFDPVGSPSGQVIYSVAGLFFPTRGAGWAAIRGEHCPAPSQLVTKTRARCVTDTYLVKTGDGGTTWAPVSQ